MTWLAGIIVAVTSGGGYAGTVALMALKSACISLPSEIIMPFAGYLVSNGRFDCPSWPDWPGKFSGGCHPAWILL